MKTKLKNILLSFGTVTTFTITSIASVACTTGEKPEAKPFVEPKKQPKIDINTWLQTKIIDEINKIKILTPENVAKVLTDNEINVDLSRGTSYNKGKVIGNKYNDIDKRFIPSYNDLSLEKRKNLTIETFANLFEDSLNSKYQIAKWVKAILEDAFKKIQEPSSSITKSTNKAKAATPRTDPIAYEFENKHALKYDDSWWTLDNLSYSNVAQLGRGTTYYQDLQIGPKTGSYPQYNIEDWINVYDSSVENVLADPKKVYASNSPSSYKASALQFVSIYNHDPSFQRTKTGNNNNGLNGLYSGAEFQIDKQNKQRTFDTSTVETLDNLYFTPNNSISNGWEHVSPQSQSKNTWEKENSKVLGKANSDLHNIRPSIQDIFNGPRSNHAFGMVNGSSNKSGVDFEIGMAGLNYKVVEPRVNARGDIARIMFYMHDRYHIKYDLDYYKQLALWAAMDPVTEEEKALDKRIANVMGFSNDYVTGKKLIPYYEDIKIKVEKANTDKSANKSSWGIAPQKPQNTLNQVIDSKAKAENLDWTQATEIFYGKAPSQTIKDGLKNEQVILKITIEQDGSIKYLKVTLTQSKAILAREFDKNYDIKIAVNDQKNEPKQFKTSLKEENLNSFGYKDMIDLISEVKYLVVS